MNIVDIAVRVGMQVEVCLYQDASGVWHNYEYEFTACPSVEQLQAFADAIGKEKDAEIERLKEKMATPYNLELHDEIVRQEREIKTANEQFTALKNVLHDTQAKIAMMRDAIQSNLADLSIEGMYDEELFEAALSSTEQDVKRWVNKVKADALEEASDINGFDSSSAAALIDSAKQLRGEKV